MRLRKDRRHDFVPTCSEYEHLTDGKRHQPGSSRGSKENPQADFRKKSPAASVVVRYGRMNSVGEFHLPKSFGEFSCAGKVVIQSDRGVEIGEPMSLTCSTCPHAIGRDQMRAYAKNSGPDFLRFQAGRVLREATPEDLIEQRHIDSQKPEKMEICKRLIARHNLGMKLVACEHVFGGERIVFYFMAEGRVDFRALVKDLADEFQTRIEMRQIGARDEARLVADYETCGRQCCCKNFLKTLKPINMRMAKMQKATLDPSKVSGRCGRLKCCLRYEHDTYEDLDRRLPRVGDKVNTTEGEGVVVGRQILTQLLHVKGSAEQAFAVSRECLLAPGEVPPPKQKPPHERSDLDASQGWRMFDTPTARPGAVGEAGPKSEAGRVPSEKDAGPESTARDQATAGPDPQKRRRRRRRGRRGRGGGPRGAGGSGGN